MIEAAVRRILRSSASLLALVGGNERRIDLLTVEEPVSDPYLTFNVTKSVRAGRPGLCDQSSLGLLQTTIMLTPWAQTANQVNDVHTSARQALLAVRGSTIEGVAIQSIAWEGFDRWHLDETTQLMTRGQVFLVLHT